MVDPDREPLAGLVEVDETGLPFRAGDEPARPGRSDEPPSGLFGRTSRLAPDDDPEFLAELDRRAAPEHEKLLGSWEEDLRRREEELRRDRGESSDGPDGPS